MQCPECRAENRPGSNFCRTCGYTLPDTQGYIPSVPPPDAKPFQDSYQQDSYQAAPPPPTVYQQPPPPPAQYTQAPPPPMPYAWDTLVCPRCASPNVAKAAPPMWAVLLA